MNVLAIAPQTCLVGEGAIEEVGKLVSSLGHRAFIIGGKKALTVAYRRVANELDRAGILHTVEEFTGECSRSQIETYAARFSGWDVVICLGGGKVIDTAKAAAEAARISCITIPTSAATCAACTALSVLSTDEGKHDVGWHLSRCPDVMIIDPEIIVTAPVRLLAAGIADALARTVETELAAHVGLPDTHAALSLGAARAYWTEVLMEDAYSALCACEAGKVTQAFNRVVEANILGAGVASGLCGGFYRLNVSHAVAYGLTHFVAPFAVLHGEMVALGILVQSLLEDPSGGKGEEMRARLAGWGLPVTFKQIGLDVDEEVGRALARQAYGYLDKEHAVPFSVTEEGLWRAIVEVENTS